MSAHGTETEYRKGCRCDECRSGATTARRLRRHGEGPGKTPPGQQVHSIRGYRRHGCRCDVCRAAWAACMRGYYARRRVREKSALVATGSVQGAA